MKCVWRGCVYPALEGLTECRLHQRFYEFALYGDSLDIDCDFADGPRKFAAELTIGFGHSPDTQKAQESEGERMCRVRACLDLCAPGTSACAKHQVRRKRRFYRDCMICLAAFEIHRKGQECCTWRCSRALTMNRQFEQANKVRQFLGEPLLEIPYRKGVMPELGTRIAWNNRVVVPE